MSDGDADLDEEMREHVRRLTEQNLAAGTSRAEARRAALTRFGSPEALLQPRRDERPAAWLDDLAGDVGFAARLLRKSRAHAADVGYLTPI